MSRINYSAPQHTVLEMVGDDGIEPPTLSV